MSAGRAQRRRTDARTTRERMAELSTEERQAAYLLGLSREVSTACDRWLCARGCRCEPFNSFDGVTTLASDSKATTGTPDASTAPPAIAPAGREEKGWQREAVDRAGSYFLPCPKSAKSAEILTFDS